MLTHIYIGSWEREKRGRFSSTKFLQHQFRIPSQHHGCFMEEVYLVARVNFLFDKMSFILCKIRFSDICHQICGNLDIMQKIKMIMIMMTNTQKMSKALIK